MATPIHEALSALYAAEQNVEISSFWDCGWRVRIGDEMNGFSAERQLKHDEFDQIGEWIISQIGNKASPKASHEQERIEQFAKSLGIEIDHKAN
jgi:hypothetical protein